jgi:hypothetical protein
MSENPNIIIPRHPGGQPGNTNALRHGFYARHLGDPSAPALTQIEMNNLLGEAAMLKDYMYKLYMSNIEVDDCILLADTLHALSLAGMALARVLDVNQRIQIWVPKHQEKRIDAMEDRLRSTVAALSETSRSLRN